MIMNLVAGDEKTYLLIFTLTFAHLSTCVKMSQAKGKKTAENVSGNHLLIIAVNHVLGADVCAVKDTEFLGVQK